MARISGRQTAHSGGKVQSKMALNQPKKVASYIERARERARRRKSLQRIDWVKSSPTESSTQEKPGFRRRLIPQRHIGNRLEKAVQVLQAMNATTRQLQRTTRIGSRSISLTPSVYKLLNHHAGDLILKEATISPKAFTSVNLVSRIDRRERKDSKSRDPEELTRGRSKKTSKTGQVPSAVLDALNSKMCLCKLSDGKRTRSYPSTKQACVAAATQFGLEWEWACDESVDGGNAS